MCPEVDMAAILKFEKLMHYIYEIEKRLVFGIQNGDSPILDFEKRMQSIHFPTNCLPNLVEMLAC